MKFICFKNECVHRSVFSFKSDHQKRNQLFTYFGRFELGHFNFPRGYSDQGIIFELIQIQQSCLHN